MSGLARSGNGFDTGREESSLAPEMVSQEVKDSQILAIDETTKNLSQDKSIASIKKNEEAKLDCKSPQTLLF